MAGGKSIDVGTNMLVSGSIGEDGKPVFKMQRDCFFRIVPKTEVNKNSIKMSLDKRQSNYIIDSDGSFIVIGQDGLDIAIERNDKAQRPMSRGVISPKEKSALPVLNLIIESLIGKGDGVTKCVYSVPGKPIDASFDIAYHIEMLGNYISKMGYKATPINEAFAIALNELLDEGLTGISISCGAGMSNICIVHSGDPLVEFSLTRSGDFIDQSVGNALDISPSLAQMEKEAGIDLFNPNTKIAEAVSVYYTSVLNYTFQNILYELKRLEKSLPIFREPIPVVMAGGLTLAGGFSKRVEDVLSSMEFPFKISEVRLASNPMTTVAAGCLLASNL